jgi:hypothetical protein
MNKPSFPLCGLGKRESYQKGERYADRDWQRPQRKDDVLGKGKNANQAISNAVK